VAKRKKPTEQEITNYMSKLDITREEAIELWECDNDISINEEQEKLQNSAYITGNEIKRVREIKRTKKKEYVRKVNQNKAELLEVLINALQDKVTDLTTVKVEKMIRFKYNEKWYTLDLVQMGNKGMKREGLV
jgi:16S rRNA U1498 N3-methylase RsmE